MTMKNYLRNDLLRNAREKRGWTQKELADQMDVGESTVRSWERGVSPHLPLRSRLCEIFGMTPEQLGFVRTDEHQEEPQTPTGVSLPPEPGDQNRQRMIKRVSTRWISGVLDHTLSEGRSIHLHLREQPEAVANPWAEAVQESILPSRAIPEEKGILDIYDDADGALLLLGNPGAGKTTLLLSLTRDLLARATLDEAHLIPVVFNLSSWAQKRLSIPSWMIEELNSKYHVPHKLAEKWVEANLVLPLLDGLDEVAETGRTECVQAINAYRKEHGFVPMVVCCQASEYQALNVSLALNNAITIEPLTLQQIENYVSSAGKHLQAVQTALKNDASLQEIVSTPLMLNIVVLAFHETSIKSILSVEDPTKQRSAIFEKYVEFVLKRRGPKSHYSREQTMHWLTWLAQQLEKHNQTEYYLERMQQDWLPDTARNRYNHTLFRVIYGIETVAIAGLFAWLRGGKVGNVTGVSIGILGWLGASPGNSILGWMAKGLGGGIEGGGMLGIIFALTVFLTTTIIDSYSEPSENLSWKSIQKGITSGLRNALLSGGIAAIGVGPLFLRASQSNFSYSLPRTIGIGLFSAMIFGLTTLLSRSLRPREKNSPTPKRKWTSRLLDGISIGAWAGIGFGIVTALEEGPSSAALLYTAIVSIACVFFGIVGGESWIRIGEIRTAETVVWSWQNIQRHMGEDIVKGASIGLSIAILVFCILSTASGLFYGLDYGISYGIIYGIITGLIVGVISLLTTVLNRGWDSSILSQDQLAQPNEGIRRSLRHSLFAGLLFGPIGGLASGLVAGGTFGLIGKLPGWPILAIGFGIVFTLILTLQFALIRGGTACIEHAILRWFLWRKRCIPLGYPNFLNYAAERILLRRVGGGYIFAHRLLLEYFVSLEEAPKEDQRTRT